MKSLLRRIRIVIMTEFSQRFKNKFASRMFGAENYDKA